MTLSLEQLALVTGGASPGTALSDDARCAQYKIESLKQRFAVGSKIGTFKTADEYLAAQAAIEQPDPPYCKK